MQFLSHRRQSAFFLLKEPGFVEILEEEDGGRQGRTGGRQKKGSKKVTLLRILETRA